MKLLATLGSALLLVTTALPTSLSGRTDSLQKASSSGPAISRNWKRLRSQNFVVEGTANAGLMQQWLEHLETFRSCMALVLPGIDLTSRVQNRIILIDDSLGTLAPPDEKGRPEKRVAGYFVELPEANYLVVSSETGDLSALYHEYAHFIIHRALHGTVPTWADEGLAEFYGTFNVDRSKKRGIIGLVNPRVSVLRRGQLLPLRTMITEDGAAKFTRDEVDVQYFYAESWALVHYLTIGTDGKRDGQLRRYLLSMAAGQSSETAFQEAFQISPEGLENELRKYLSGMSIPTASLPMPEGRIAAGPAEPMFEWESQQVQGRLLTSFGQLADAEKRLTAAMASAPAEPDVVYAVAALRRAERRPEEALAMLEPVLSRASSGFGPRFEYALALTDVGQHEKAIPEYERASALNPEVPSLWFGLSLSLVATGRLDDAELSMHRVRALDPDPKWYATRSQAAWTFGADSLMVDDALRYTSAVGFKTETGMYTALHAVLAGRRIKADAKVKTLMDGLAAAVQPKSWPAAILLFLQGHIDGATLVARASGNGQLTEAHAFAGLLGAIEGRDAEALPHLNWVLERGARNFVEYELVQGEMKRRAAKR